MSRHRGDISVAVSVVVLLVVLSGWGIRSTRYGYGRATPPQPSLSLFERTLVGLGLAELPPTPVYTGNPNVQVWVDLHTALYYCPESDLYGRTAGGKFETQRDAQLDQFEPAGRKNCR